MGAADASEFERLVSPHRVELRAYCYRLLGSIQDAEDALQEALLGAWRGLEGFEGRSSERSWLYRIATHACYRILEQRGPRLLSDERGPATSGVEVEPFVDGPWLEPYPLPADAAYELRESVELAFVAALQHLPATQRATLVLRDVLGFAADETAELLETTVVAINSALQRARESLSRRLPARTQQHELKELGSERERELVARFVAAWSAQDTASLVTLLTSDVKFRMPPIPTWFDGRDATARFFAERVFEQPWRLTPLRAAGQLAFACYQGPDFKLGALNVVSLRGGAIATMTGFLDPAVHRMFSLPDR
jgi:RNA polymerase sigma-70 factor (TIGR02960 family)